jgi:hypothetical protein
MIQKVFTWSGEGMVALDKKLTAELKDGWRIEPASAQLVSSSHGYSRFFCVLSKPEHDPIAEIKL